MVDYGGFEGNAQTLHILSRVEKKETQRKVDGEIRPFDHTGSDLRLGLNLTFRSLASVLKYDEGIPERKEDRKKPGRIKGYYLCDEQLVKEIKRHVVGREDIGNFKTVECSIMDIADDIAYSTYDLEDCFKADLLEPFGLFTVDAEIRKTVREKVNKRLDEYYSDIPATEREIDDKDILRCLFDVFGDLFTISADEKRELANRNTAKEWKKLISSSAVRQLSRKIADDGYERTRATSGLVERFIDGIEVLPHPEFPQLHRVRLRVDIFKTVEVLKNITFEAVILSPAMQLVEYRGKEVIHSIFKAIEKEEKKVHLLLPEDYRNIYLQAKGSAKKRIICDFISGMTDRYAWEFYNRLCGTIPSSIFDPVE